MTLDSGQLAVRAVASDDLDLVHASKNGDVAALTWLIRITLNQSLLKLRKQRAIRDVSLDEGWEPNR